MTDKQIKLADAIINYIAGSNTLDIIISIITEEEWQALNSKYKFSGDSYNLNSDEYYIIVREFPNL